MDLTILLGSISLVLFQLYPRDFRSRTAISLFGAYLISKGQLLSWPDSGLSRPFAALWTLQFFLEVVWKVVLYPKFFSPLRKLPGPKSGSFFMGNFAEIRRYPTGIPHRNWINSIPNDGIIRYLSLFNMERLLITSPEALREVLNTKNYEFQKPYNMRFNLGRILGVGVLLAEGDEHKKQRRDLGPAFKFGHVKNLYPIFWDKSRECVEAMTEEIQAEARKNTTTDGRPAAVIEVGNWASRVTLDIIGVTGLGRDFGAIKDPHNELNQTYQKIFKPTRQGQILGTLQLILPAPLLDLLPVKRNLDVHSAAHIIRATCADLIREKKQKLALGEPIAQDILSAALSSEVFTDENLVDQLMTFLAAGHETTASAVTWAVYLLARHQDVQTRLRTEIHKHIPSISKPGATVLHSDIDNMPYLNAVCNEVLRYYSPVPLTLREAAVDTTIMGQKIPKGTQVMLVPWAVNKSESMWGPDALEFRPDRWMPKYAGDTKAASGSATSNYSFLTFLHGPRSCIGQQFAKGEFACLVASWVGRFEFELHNKEETDESKIDIKGGITARPSKGMFVKATVVEGW
ncbi:cytochrome P450 4V2 [Cladorrhinum sp. PSN332]|nr:cytochrome P450 4V2 [Cladorrhinum sp. PSN332]